MSKVLIVDDDPDLVEAVRLHLERAGHAVVSADNREDGMRTAQEGQIDLLILDVMMTELDDGIVMAQELRKSGFDKPVLMMSGISRVTGLAYDKDAEIIPAADFLEKPVRPETLIAKVNALLNP